MNCNSKIYNDIGIEAEYILRIDGVGKKYRGFSLENISFQIPRGTIMGLLGRNGAGKTTLIQLLLGHTKQSSGIIHIGRYNMAEDMLKAQQQLGFVVDKPVFFKEHTIWRNADWFGSFYPEYSPEEMSKWIKICQLDGGKRVQELSKGELVKLQFAFAMSHHCKLLILDEPTGNLDPVFRKEFLRILQETVDCCQVSVLISTHLTEDLEQIADDITILEQGRMLYTGSMEEIKQRYQIVKGSPDAGKMLKKQKIQGILGCHVTNVGFEAMADKAWYQPGMLEQYAQEKLLWEEADLSAAMYYLTRGGK